MTSQSPEFLMLMTDAQRVINALDGNMQPDGSKAANQAVAEARRVYSRLHEFRGTVRMTQAENVLLQNSLDMLRSRLRFLGQEI